MKDRGSTNKNLFDTNIHIKTKIYFGIDIC